MKQLTIRGMDEELERRLVELAEREELSLNQAALRLMKAGAGLGPRGGSAAEGPREGRLIGDSLDDLAGTWSEEDEREFREAVAHLETVDEEYPF